ncbi:hypothetical protein [Synechococcus sp. KORDI-52]|uniref:hypothetical protein n=1 Tax=Synechococcus sp. KORDI-52 TaxID=585425 RepID=UPI000AEFEB6B|nr:hypothetical protein [Synechococcus sp. KORDI-52]
MHGAAKRLEESLVDNPVSIAWVIVGQESSGSKFIAKTMAKIFHHNDYKGTFFSLVNSSLIYHRSCPFGRPKNGFDFIKEEIEIIRSHCPCVNIIFTTRSKNISFSRKALRFGDTTESAHADLVDLDRLYEYLVNLGNLLFVWNYETMCLLREKYFKRLYDYFGINSHYFPNVNDSNEEFLFNSIFFADEYSSIALTCNINLYRKKNAKELDSTQLETIKSLKKALYASVNRQLKIVVSVASRDLRFFHSLFRGENRIVVRSLGIDSCERQKPYIRDILDHDLYTTTNSNDQRVKSYCMYLNADICVPNYFFEFLFQQLIGFSNTKFPGNLTKAKKTFDCIVINRRDVIGDDLYWHPGSDLFVFPSEWLASMRFGNVCIGLPPIGPILWLNCLYHSKSALQVSDLFITHHIGNDQSWKDSKVQDDVDLNMRSAAEAFRSLIGSDKRNLSKFDMEKHSILAKKRLKHFILQWTSDLDKED